MRGRPKVVPDDIQRKYILRHAYELFSSEGYGRTTTDEVAARCKISKRTLYRLFPSKSALFAAIIDAHRQSMLDLPGDYDDLPLATALERIFRVDIDEEADRLRIALLRLLIVESAQYPELRDITHRRGRDLSLTLLTDWLAHQRARGRIDIDDPEAGAKVLMDMLFGAIAVKAGIAGEVDWPGETDHKSHLRRCIDIFLNGVVPR